MRICLGQESQENVFRYLAREKKIADHWYPADSRAQARVDEYMEWQHLNTRAHCATYFIHRWLIPMQTKKIDQKKVASAEKTMISCLDDFERVWLGGGEKSYVAGDNISVADILAVCEDQKNRCIDQDRATQCCCDGEL